MDSQLLGRVHAFAPPTGLERVAICSSTGTLPCGECRDVVEEVFLEGTAPTRRCTAEMFAQLNSQENRGSSSDSWTRRWAERN
jgi:membrane carboxypeptidase/penicillin-binding protein